MFVVETETLPEVTPGTVSTVIVVAVGIDSTLRRTVEPNNRLSPMVMPALEATLTVVPELPVTNVEKELNLKRDTNLQNLGLEMLKPEPEITSSLPAVGLINLEPTRVKVGISARA
jgi:hypothetical protein